MVRARAAGVAGADDEVTVAGDPRTRGRWQGPGMTSTAASGSAESEHEREDRQWQDVLQELRVMQTGVQLLAGILLTLPFQGPFADLDTTQRTVYLVLVVLAAVTTMLVMTPVALHRRLAGRGVKDRLVDWAHRLVVGVLTLVGLIVVVMTEFVFDVVVDRQAGLVAAALMSAVVVLLLVVLPRLVVDRSG